MHWQVFVKLEKHFLVTFVWSSSLLPSAFKKYISLGSYSLSMSLPTPEPSGNSNLDVVSHFHLKLWDPLIFTHLVSMVNVDSLWQGLYIQLTRLLTSWCTPAALITQQNVGWLNLVIAHVPIKDTSIQLVNCISRVVSVSKNLVPIKQTGVYCIYCAVGKTFLRETKVFDKAGYLKANRKSLLIVHKGSKVSLKIGCGLRYKWPVLKNWESTIP